MYKYTEWKQKDKNQVLSYSEVVLISECLFLSGCDSKCLFSELLYSDFRFFATVQQICCKETVV